MKNIRIFISFFHFLVVKFSVYLNRHVFVMTCSCEMNLSNLWTSKERSLGVQIFGVYTIVYISFICSVKRTDQPSLLIE